MLLPPAIILLVAGLLLMAKGFKIYLWRRLVRWGRGLKDRLQSRFYRRPPAQPAESLDDGWADILGDDEPRVRFTEGVAGAEALPLLPPAEPEPVRHRSTLLEKITGVALFLLFASYFELAAVVLSLFQPCDAYNFMAEFPWVPCSYDDGQYPKLAAVARFPTICLCSWVVGSRPELAAAAAAFLCRLCLVVRCFRDLFGSVVGRCPADLAQPVAADQRRRGKSQRSSKSRRVATEPG